MVTKRKKATTKKTISRKATEKKLKPIIKGKLTDVKVIEIKDKNDMVLLSGKIGKNILDFEMSEHGFNHLKKSWKLSEEDTAIRMLCKKHGLLQKEVT